MRTLLGVGASVSTADCRQQFIAAANETLRSQCSPPRACSIGHGQSEASIAAQIVAVAGELVASANSATTKASERQVDSMTTAL